tara:strand:- start:160 stop:294 length:135 start_codon:yes stop_codon:yes gene_type:complete
MAVWQSWQGFKTALFAKTKVAMFREKRPFRDFFASHIDMKTSKK